MTVISHHYDKVQSQHLCFLPYDILLCRLMVYLWTRAVLTTIFYSDTMLMIVWNVNCSVKAMKDKRLELKLSVSGDGSLSRGSNRSSTRSNRSNASNNGPALPVSEIFAIDRFSAPQHQPFDIQDRYQRQPIQYGYPAQSLQTLNHYDRSQRYRDGARSRNNPYIDYTEPVHHDGYPYSPNYQYQSVYNDPHNRIYATLSRPDKRNHQVLDYNTVPRSILQRVPNSHPHSLPRVTAQRGQSNNPQYYNSLPRYTQEYASNNEDSGLYTLPAVRRVRISEQPVIYGYGM